ncbi:molybdate ABC transporter permease subunit [Phycicoccus sp. BSK3Z-2]|uniref:Molybdenum transport system permease n=1 Tax=Phycicoccus avicenniae TaxID=2828860 RepID=A0A941D7J9_9MICO|nr:ABC transporter permease [Phycicoccus avicenniae]MBR7741962.1 molybdate ABC transporter permease subunit [Phycicoccus avicenniae]
MTTATPGASPEHGAPVRRPRPGLSRPGLSRAVLLVPAGLGVALVVLPLVGLLLRTDWPRILENLSAPLVWPAIRLSLLTTLATVAVCCVLGTPLAWLLARADGRAASWLRAVLTVPVVLPPVVGGVALLMAYGRRGVVGAPVLELLGLRLPFTPTAVVLAQVFVSLPFFVLAVEGAMRGVDARYDAVAATLGASPLRVFTRVALPLAGPGIASGAALAWARALGEFGATITFAGNFEGRTQTAPLAVYVALQNDPQAAIALSIAMLAVSLLVLGLLRGRWLR